MVSMNFYLFRKINSIIISINKLNLCMGQKYCMKFYVQDHIVLTELLLYSQVFSEPRSNLDFFFKKKAQQELSNKQISKHFLKKKNLKNHLKCVVPQLQWNTFSSTDGKKQKKEIKLSQQLKQCQQYINSLFRNAKHQLPTVMKCIIKNITILQKDII